MLIGAWFGMWTPHETSIVTLGSQAAIKKPSAACRAPALHRHGGAVVQVGKLCWEFFSLQFYATISIFQIHGLVMVRWGDYFVEEEAFTPPAPWNQWCCILRWPQIYKASWLMEVPALHPNLEILGMKIMLSFSPSSLTPSQSSWLLNDWRHWRHL